MDGDAMGFKTKLKMQKDKFFASLAYSISKCQCGLFVKYGN